MRLRTDLRAIGLGRPLIAGALLLAALSPLAIHSAQTALAATRHARGGAAAPGAGATRTAARHRHAGLRLSIRSADLNVLRGGYAHVSGRLHPALAGGLVLLQVRRHHHWATVAHATVGDHGSFRIRYRPHSLGSHLARLRVVGAPLSGGSLALPAACATTCAPILSAAAPKVTATRALGQLGVFRLAEASWYGGGGGLACGGTLTSATMGVANKTLPCGTLVTLRYGTRAVRVPVIDRGPYVAGREFDLTEATKDALGFPDTGALWSSR